MLTPSLSRSAAKTHIDFISGPVRIKDALYMGDEIAAKVIQNSELGYGFHSQ